MRGFGEQDGADVVRHLRDVRRARRSELIDRFGRHAVGRAESRSEVRQEGHRGALWLVYEGGDAFSLGGGL
jgi:hypothetical protein